MGTDPSAGSGEVRCRCRSGKPLRPQPKLCKHFLNAINPKPVNLDKLNMSATNSHTAVRQNRDDGSENYIKEITRFCLTAIDTRRLACDVISSNYHHPIWSSGPYGSLMTTKVPPSEPKW